MFSMNFSAMIIPLLVRLNVFLRSVTNISLSIWLKSALTVLLATQQLLCYNEGFFCPQLVAMSKRPYAAWSPSPYQSSTHKKFNDVNIMREPYSSFIREMFNSRDPLRELMHLPRQDDEDVKKTKKGNNAKAKKAKANAKRARARKDAKKNGKNAKAMKAMKATKNGKNAKNAMKKAMKKNTNAVIKKTKAMKKAQK